MKKIILVALMLAFFAGGYITGSIHTKNAIAAELGALGGTIESLRSLGRNVILMQENVNKLQTNINDVKKIKDDIATYTGVYNSVTGKEGGAQGQQMLNDQLQKGLNNLMQPKPSPQPGK